MSGPIGTLGTIPTITVGGRVFTDLANLKILFGTVVGATYSNLYDVSDGFTPGAYVAGGASGFFMQAFDLVLQQATGGTGQAGGLFYGDTALGDNAAGPLTTPVGMITGAGNVTTKGDLFVSDAFGTGPSRIARAMGGFCATGKYPHLYLNTALNVTISVYGYEV